MLVLSPGRAKNFHFFILTRLALGLSQPPMQWVLGAHSPGGGGKVAGM
jgi:hypothetical protein